jgi:hypothetical protein
MKTGRTRKRRDKEQKGSGKEKLRPAPAGSCSKQASFCFPPFFIFIT